MGIVIYTKGKAPERRKKGRDLFKEVRKLRKINKILLISILLSVGFIIYQNKDSILTIIKEFYGKLA